MDEVLDPVAQPSVSGITLAPLVPDQGQAERRHRNRHGQMTQLEVPEKPREAFWKRGNHIRTRYKSGNSGKVRHKQGLMPAEAQLSEERVDQTRTFSLVKYCHVARLSVLADR